MNLVRAFAAAVASVAAIIVILALFGHAPRETAMTIAGGSFGSSFATSETLIRAIPLILASLAVIVAFRAGVWNIGAEGQFIAGAIAAFAAARPVDGSVFAIPIALVAGAAGGAAWGAIAAFLKNKRNAPEVLTTILLNFVALHLLGFLVNGPLQETRAQYPQSELLAAALPTIGRTRLHVGLLLAVALAVIVHWLLYSTRFGLRIRAIGSNERAARYAAIAVERHLFLTFAISGALAGLAGAVEVTGVTHRLYERVASGYGYSGITVALLAALQPVGALAAATFVGALRAGAAELQRAMSIPSAIASVAEGVAIVILLLVSYRRGERAP